MFINSYKYNTKPGKPLLLSPRFLDQSRVRISFLQCSLNIEKVYVYRLRCFIGWYTDQHIMRQAEQLAR